MLPSIRKLTKDLKVSRTTVEAAYEILIDQGYVQNLPSRGFRITLTKPAVPVEMPPLQEESFHRPSFNFANHYIDTTTFDTVLCAAPSAVSCTVLIRSQVTAIPKGNLVSGKSLPATATNQGELSAARNRSLSAPVSSPFCPYSSLCFLSRKTSQFRSSRLSPS